MPAWSGGAVGGGLPEEVVLTQDSRTLWAAQGRQRRGREQHARWAVRSGRRNPRRPRQPDRIRGRTEQERGQILQGPVNHGDGLEATRGSEWREERFRLRFSQGTLGPCLWGGSSGEGGG